MVTIKSPLSNSGGIIYQIPSSSSMLGNSCGSSSSSYSSFNNDCYILSLPNEVFEVIMKCFTCKEVCQYISTLSRHFNTISKSNSLWQYFCIKDFKIINELPKLITNKQIDWYKEYIILFQGLEEIAITPIYTSDESLKIVNNTNIKKQSGTNAYYSDNSLVPLSDRCSHHLLSKYNNQIIYNTRQTKPDSTLFVQSKKKVMPLPFGNYTVAYFEIKLIDSGVDQNIFIGYSTSCEINDKKQVLRQAVSYHGIDGGMYANPVMGKAISDPWVTGDIVGCGFDFVNRNIFFTLNGRFLGKSTSSVSVTKLHATIGTISCSDQFSVNFGQKNFEYDIIQHQNEQYYQQQQQSIKPTISIHLSKYPLYSIQRLVQEKYMVELFDDVDEFSKFHDEEMNKIASPINKEITYLSDFETYRHTDRIMKNKIHKYCHQIGQQINGGFTISPEDQTNIAELRRGLAWYWMATKQHYLLLYFARISVQRMEIDNKYSPSHDLVPPLPSSPNSVLGRLTNNYTLEDTIFLEDSAKRRMTKEIGVLLSSTLDIAHPFVTSVMGHARLSVQRFQQNITEEQQLIYQDFEQMLQAAEQADQRMFLALSLSIITQTKEIIKNKKSKLEKKLNYIKKEREMRRLELDHLSTLSVNIDKLMDYNNFIITEYNQNIDNNNNSLNDNNNIGIIEPTTNNNLPLLEMMTEEQGLEQRHNYIQRNRESLKLEINELTKCKDNNLSDYAIDIIVWTFLRLSRNINNDVGSCRKEVLDILLADNSQLEKEYHKVHTNIVNLKRTKSKQSFSSFSESFFPTTTSTTSPNNINSGSTIPLNNNITSSTSNPHLSISISQDEISLDESQNGIGVIQMHDLRDDVLSPLRPKKKRKVSRPIVIGSIVVGISVIILFIILLSVFIETRAN